MGKILDNLNEKFSSSGNLISESIKNIDLNSITSDSSGDENLFTTVEIELNVSDMGYLVKGFTQGKILNPVLIKETFEESSMYYLRSSINIVDPGNLMVIPLGDSDGIVVEYTVNENGVSITSMVYVNNMHFEMVSSETKTIPKETITRVRYSWSFSYGETTINFVHAQALNSVNLLQPITMVIFQNINFRDVSVVAFNDEGITINQGDVIAWFDIDAFIR